MSKGIDDATNIPYGIASNILRKVRGKLENKQCFDCLEKNPQWASITFGILLCNNCSGIHRGLSTDVSFIRSTTMDGWKVSQLKRMFAGGNSNANQHFAKYGVNVKDSNPSQIYASKPAKLYQRHLDQKVKHYLFDQETMQQIVKCVEERKQSKNSDTESDSSSDDDTHQIIENMEPKQNKMIYKSHIIAKKSSKRKKKKKKKIPFLNDDDFSDFDDLSLSTKKTEANKDKKKQETDPVEDEFDLDNLEASMEKEKQDRIKLKQKQENDKKQRQALQITKHQECETRQKEQKKKENKKRKDRNDLFSSLDAIANKIKKEQKEKNMFIYNTTINNQSIF